MPSTQANVFSARESTKSISNYWAALYKVYARIELNKQGNSANIEIIDGYLHDGEELNIQSLYNLKNLKTKVLVIEINKKLKKNTYLKTDAFDFLSQETNQLLVCIQKENKLIGYQFIDLENNLLGEPKFSAEELNASY